MIDYLKPYPEYKNTLSAWLKTVPKHWGVQSLRTLIKPRAERNRPDLPLLSVARERGVFVRSLTDLDENHNVIPDDLSNYKVARRGNLVINKMKAWQGSMGIAPCDGIVSPAYFVFDLSITNGLFAQAMFRSKPYVAHFGQASDGVRIGQWDLSIPGMREIPVLLPPPDEQAAIVRFLDHANGKIERAIRAKRKLIALLNEQKQAIIHRAVTRGLDPAVKLKPSGIPWLGDVPEHWEVLRFSRIIKEGPRNGTSPPVIQENVGFESFSISAVRDGKVEIRIEDVKYVAIKDIDPSEYDLRSGDILLVRGNGNIRLVGKAGLIEKDLPGRVYPDLLMRVRLRPSVSSEYIVLVLNSPMIRQQIELAARTTVGTFKVNNQQVRQFWFALPSLSEANAILDYCMKATEIPSSAITRAEREIALLREYRTTLTAEVVTGKLDVREAATLLPAESEVPPPTDDLPEDEISDDLLEEAIA